MLGNDQLAIRAVEVLSVTGLVLDNVPGPTWMDMGDDLRAFYEDMVSAVIRHYEEEGGRMRPDELHALWYAGLNKLGWRCDTRYDYKHRCSPDMLPYEALRTPAKLALCLFSVVAVQLHETRREIRRMKVSTPEEREAAEHSRREEEKLRDLSRDEESE